MKRWITAIGTVAMMNGGCDPIVLVPVEPQPVEAEEEPPPPSPNALAMRAGDWPLPPVASPASFTEFTSYLFHPKPSLGHPPPHPDSLVLVFSESVQECSQPVLRPSTELPADPDADTHDFWQVILVIPPELNRPGLIDLRDDRIGTYLGFWNSPYAGGIGSSGGSGEWTSVIIGTTIVPGKREKTLEIVSSDASSVSVKLDWGDPPFDGGNINGDYTATYCGDAPPVSPPLPGLVLQGGRHQATPQGDDPTPAFDPAALHLVLGTAATSCEQPSPPIGCTGTSRMSLSLPPELQRPGLIDLTDPAVHASFSVSTRSAADCVTENLISGSFTGGTVDILSIDASGVSARVYGSYTEFNWGGIDVDGLYAASMCP
ncbi:hypothetical protein WME89_37575 [Sorangium sp. So ce321]|uniref:hypothetical protein n=1 Tax=Sorangium sp. So ce321 TaxID=3133300 RepID=UPI003F5EC11A